MMRLLKASPSKFGKGVGLLWRGADLIVLNAFLNKLFIAWDAASLGRSETFLFESARAALSQCLLAMGVGQDDEVIISAFTCDAVTYGVRRIGAKVVYVDINPDLTMHDKAVLEAIRNETKAVVVQNTFGRLGLRPETIAAIKSRGIHVIEDCALAIGSQWMGQNLGTFADVSIWSLEVSKTATIGWGGVAAVNNERYAESFSKHYQTLPMVPKWGDARRLFQLWFSVLMTRLGMPGGVLVWTFMYGSRLFRRSNNHSDLFKAKRDKMGCFSRRLFGHIEPMLPEIYSKTNKNYLQLAEEAQRLGLQCPVIEKTGERIVSPRFPLMVEAENIDQITKLGEKMGVEVGRWFSEAPPQWNLSDARIHSDRNARHISQHIINLPCHWTLKEEELSRLKQLLALVR